ncbi:MAG: hypothetical protein K0S65_3643 [Labilithrix sp.]|jgi:hypothetical protein|nr:hypothetical protein [Labilithrix sp.]
MSARDDILARFTRQKPDAEQIRAVETSTKVFHAAASFVTDCTKPSREQSLALTALEEAKFWANQGIVLNGVPEDVPAPQGETLLAAEFNDGGDTDATTVGEYLAELLITLLTEEEGFSGKRPFGNSGWIADLEEAVGLDPEQLHAPTEYEPLFKAIREALK